jgi:hypothetical protein
MQVIYCSPYFISAGLWLQDAAGREILRFFRVQYFGGRRLNKLWWNRGQNTVVFAEIKGLQIFSPGFIFIVCIFFERIGK